MNCKALSVTVNFFTVRKVLNLFSIKNADVYLRKAAFMAVVLTVIIGSALSCQAAVNERLSNPRSHLGSSNDSPVFLGLYCQIGSAFDYDSGLPGGGAFLLFRPDASVDFMSFLYKWNTGLILQADYIPISSGDRFLLSADLLFRRYFQEMRGDEAPGSTFFGLGLGASKAQLTATTRGKYWSWIAELGREWTVLDKYAFWVKIQYRHYSFRQIDYSNLTAQLAVALPLPW